jgi:hypothetical protein
MYRRQLAQPVHSIAYTDLTGDGVNELVCVTFDAVYIFQVLQPWVGEKKKRGSRTVTRHTWIKACTLPCRLGLTTIAGWIPPLVTGLWAHSYCHARVCSMTWTARPTY